MIFYTVFNCVKVIKTFKTDTKKYDAIFYGSICGKTHEKIVEKISSFDYNFTTYGTSFWRPNEPVNMHSLASKITKTNIGT